MAAMLAAHILEKQDLAAGLAAEKLHLEDFFRDNAKETPVF